MLEREQALLIDQLYVDRAAVIARERKKADERELRLLDKYQAKDQELREALKQAGMSAAKVKELQRARTRLAQERLRLTAELVARSREFEIELAAYREAVTVIAQSPSSEKRAALQRYADGDRKGAYAVLGEIIDAENKARAKAANVASAANTRQKCPLAFDMKDRGDTDTGEVVKCYEQVVGYDDGEPWDWFALVGLYQESGALPKAQQAAQEGLGAASAKWKITPDSAQAQHDLLVSNGMLGDVAVKAGDLVEARRWYEQAMRINETLAKNNPTSAQAQRDLSVSYDRLGDVAVKAGDFVEARRRYEQALKVGEALAKNTSAEAQRDLSVSYSKLGDVAVKAGDLVEARRRYEQPLKVSEALAKNNPTSAKAQRDLSASYNKLGNVAVMVEDLAEARRRYELALKVSEGLAKNNPTSAEAQRDLAVSWWKLGLASESRAAFEQTVAILTALKSTGRLFPTDEEVLKKAMAIVRDLAAPPATPPPPPNPTRDAGVGPKAATGGTQP